MKARRGHVHNCPHCGARVVRVHRHLGDRLVAVVAKVHRYRCSNRDCAWEGIVSLPTAQKQATRRREVTWTARLGWMSVGIAIASIGAGTIAWFHDDGGTAPPVAARAVHVPRSSPPPSEIFDALALANEEFGALGVRTPRGTYDGKASLAERVVAGPSPSIPDDGFVSMNLPMAGPRESYPVEFVSAIPAENHDGLTFAPHDVGSTADPASLSLVSPGESFDGFTLPPDDERLTRNATELSMRRGCAWGAPGRTPYKGTVRQALAGAGLPQEVVNKIDLMVERKMVSDRVTITRDAIQAVNSKRRFEPTISAMGFGKTLCFGTRVNFPAGHVEVADLYEATDGEGAKFSVMVPYVCGNVSVLAARAERAATPPGGSIRSIPEPGTLASLAAALAAMAGGAGLSRRRADRRSGTP